MSSDEDDNSHRQREFQTSFEEEGAKPSHRAALYATTSPNTLSKITAKASDDSDKMDISSPYNACETSCLGSHSPGVILCTYFSAAAPWQTELNQDDLSGVTPMDTAAGLVDWTKEPHATSPSCSHSNWADFSSFGTQSEQHSPQ